MTGSRGGRSVIQRAVCTIGLVAIAGGCEESYADRHPVEAALIAGFAHGLTHQAKPAKKVDHILQYTARQADAGFTIRPKRELWRPFRLEASLGLPDASHADLGTNGSFSVAVVDAPQFVYYEFDVKRSGAGVVVTANAPGAAPVGTLAIPDSLVADVAIEDTGGSVVFYARKYGDAAYVTIGSVPVTKAGPYRASIDASGLPKGTVIGYDLFRVTTNGAPPSPTAAQTARETIFTAIEALAEASYAMDGPLPDRTKAGDQLDLAVTRLDAALALDLTAFKNARTNLSSARKKAAKLVAGARAKRSANSVFAALVGIAKLAGRAADAVN
jgi:hypothetical protein